MLPQCPSIGYECLLLISLPNEQNNMIARKVWIEELNMGLIFEHWD